MTRWARQSNHVQTRIHTLTHTSPVSLGEPDPGPLPYKLTGVIEHTGSLSSGHYTTYVRERVPQEGDDDASIDASSAWFRLTPHPCPVQPSPARVQVPLQRLRVRAHHTGQRAAPASLHAVLPTARTWPAVGPRNKGVGWGEGGCAEEGVLT